jgi:O-mycaminosyltylonolide 6-deoxyallosyltransferase
MRVALLALGSRGDVQPFIALGLGLRARGHEVSLGAPADLKALVESSGLEFRLIPGSPDDFFRTPGVIESLRRSPSMIRAGRAMTQPSQDELEQSLLTMNDVARDADLVVNSLLAKMAAGVEPERPWVSVSWWPNTTTSAFPAFGMPNLPLGRVYNRATHGLSATAEWMMARKIVNGARRRVGRSPLGRSSPFGDLGRQRPYLYPFSPSVLQPPRDWPEHSHITGYWFWDKDWTPPAALTDFLAAGPPPVVATFGSTWAVHRPEQTLEFLVGAARASGRRLIMVDGPEDNLPDDVLRVHEVDYDWLFRRAAAVIHHGGYGTTGAVLRAGVPHVVVPTYADHPFWARRLFDLGLSSAPVPFPDLTGDRLREALTNVLHDDTARRRAAQFGRYVDGDRGIDNACEILEDWMKQ